MLKRAHTKEHFSRLPYSEGHCHGHARLLNFRHCDNPRYDENQLCRLPVPARNHPSREWRYLRVTLSLRDVEDLLAERGIIVSYETVRRWVNHFGPIIAADLRRRRPKPHSIWHLDEVYLKIDGRMVYLWRAVDAEGEVLDVLVQSKINKHAALKLMRKLLNKYAIVPQANGHGRFQIIRRRGPRPGYRKPP
jgi:hypothetical protein